MYIYTIYMYIYITCCIYMAGRGSGFDQVVAILFELSRFHLCWCAPLWTRPRNSICVVGILFVELVCAAVD